MLLNITTGRTFNHQTLGVVAMSCLVARQRAFVVVSQQPRSVMVRFLNTIDSGVQSGPSNVFTRPLRNTGITIAERAALRAARKERATKFMADQQVTTTTNVSGATGGTGRVTRTNLATSHFIWYLSVGIPAGLLIWGFNDENSPPAKFCRITGITSFIRSYTDEIAKPVYDKLLPDWSQVMDKNFHFRRICQAVIFI
jgi:hypothetical protein